MSLLLALGAPAPPTAPVWFVPRADSTAASVSATNYVSQITALPAWSPANNPTDTKQAFANTYPTSQAVLSFVSRAIRLPLFPPTIIDWPQTWANKDPWGRNLGVSYVSRASSPPPPPPVLRVVNLFWPQVFRGEQPPQNVLAFTSIPIRPPIHPPQPPAPPTMLYSIANSATGYPSSRTAVRTRAGGGVTVSLTAEELQRLLDSLPPEQRLDPQPVDEQSRLQKLALSLPEKERERVMIEIEDEEIAFLLSILDTDGSA